MSATTAALNILINTGTSLSSLNRLTNATSKFNSGMMMTMRNATSMQRSVGMAFTAMAAAAMPAMALRSFARFDKQMRATNTVARLSEKALVGVRKEVMALSDSFGMDPSVMAEGLTEIYQSGIKGAMALRTLDSAAQLAVGGVADMVSSTKLLMNIMNAFDMRDSQRIIDVMFRTQERGMITVKELAKFFGVLSGSAAAANVSLEDTGAAMAVLTKRGLPANQAATALRAMFFRLTKPSKQMEALFASTGGTAKTLITRNLGLVYVMRKLRDATGGALDQLSKLGFYQRDIKAAAILSNPQAFKMFMADRKRMMTAMGQGKTAAEQMFKAFQKGLDRLTTALTNFSITLGYVFQSDLTGLLQNITSFVRGLSKWVEANQKIIKTVAKVVAILAALSVARLVFRMLVFGAMGLVTPFVTLLAIMGKVFSMAGRMGQRMAGVFGMGTPAGKAPIPKTPPKPPIPVAPSMRANYKAGSAAGGAFAQGFVGNMTYAGQAVISFAKAIVTRVPAAMQPLASELKGIWGKAFTDLSNGPLKDLQRVFAPLVQSSAIAANAVKKTMLGMASSLGSGLVTIGRGYGEMFRDIRSGFASMATAGMSKARELGKNIYAGLTQSKFTGIMPKMHTFINPKWTSDFASKVTAMRMSVMQTFKGFHASASAMTSSSAMDLLTSGAWSRMGMAATSAFEKVGAGFQTLRKHVAVSRVYLGTLAQPMVSGFAKATSRVSGFLKGLRSEAAVFGGMLGRGTSAVGRGAGAVGRGVGAAGRGVGAVLAPVYSASKILAGAVVKTSAALLGKNGLVGAVTAASRAIGRSSIGQGAKNIWGNLKGGVGMGVTYGGAAMGGMYGAKLGAGMGGETGAMLGGVIGSGLGMGLAGAAMAALGTLGTGSLGIFTTIISSISGVVAAIAGIGGAWVAAGAVIIGAIAAIASYAMIPGDTFMSKWETVKGWLSGFWGWLKEAFWKASEFAVGFVLNFSKNMTIMFNWLKDNGGKLITNFVGWLGSLPGTIVKVLASVGSMVTKAGMTIFLWLSDNFEVLLGKMWEQVTTWLKKIPGMVGRLWGWLTDIISGESTVDQVADQMNEIAGVMQKQYTGVDLGVALRENLEPDAIRIGELIGNSAKKIVEDIKAPEFDLTGGREKVNEYRGISDKINLGKNMMSAARGMEREVTKRDRTRFALDTLVQKGGSNKWMNMSKRAMAGTYDEMLSGLGGMYSKDRINLSNAFLGTMKPITGRMDALVPRLDEPVKQRKDLTMGAGMSYMARFAQRWTFDPALVSEVQKKPKAPKEEEQAARTTQGKLVEAMGRGSVEAMQALARASGGRGGDPINKVANNTKKANDYLKSINSNTKKTSTGAQVTVVT